MADGIRHEQICTIAQLTDLKVAGNSTYGQTILHFTATCIDRSWSCSRAPSALCGHTAWHLLRAATTSLTTCRKYLTCAFATKICCGNRPSLVLWLVGIARVLDFSLSSTYIDQRNVICQQHRHSRISWSCHGRHGPIHISLSRVLPTLCNFQDI